MCSVHKVALDCEILIYELRRVGVVGVDSANLRRRQVNLVDRLFAEKSVDIGLPQQIQFLTTACYEFHVITGTQMAHQGRADHAPVTSHEDASRHAQFRSEEHTSELQYLMRISNAVFCLNKKNKN